MPLVSFHRRLRWIWWIC